MTIANSTILVGGTPSVTGGTSTALLSKDSGGSGDNHIVMLDNGAALLSQETIDFTCRHPKVSSGAPSGYTQARNGVFHKMPKILANGKRTVNTGNIQLSVDVETTVAEKLAMRVALMQLLFGADFLKFWDDQTTA